MNNIGNARRRLLSLDEQIMRDALSDSAPYFGARIYPKYKLADVFKIDSHSLPDADLYSYALRSHFDFVSAVNEYASFALELDSGDHWADAKVAARDRKKQMICDLFDFPMLRVAQRLITPLFMHGVLGLLPFMWHTQKKNVTQEALAPLSRVAEQGVEYAALQAVSPGPLEIEEITLTDRLDEAAEVYAKGCIDRNFSMTLKRTSELIAKIEQLEKFAVESTVEVDGLGYSVGTTVVEIDQQLTIVAWGQSKVTSSWPIDGDEIAVDLSIINAAIYLDACLKERRRMAKQPVVLQAVAEVGAMSF
jgi:hypothetical protein